MSTYSLLLWLPLMWLFFLVGISCFKTGVVYRSVTFVSSLLIGSVELESPAIGCGRNKCCLIICDGARVDGSDLTGAIAFWMLLKRENKQVLRVFSMPLMSKTCFISINDHYLAHYSLSWVEWVVEEGERCYATTLMLALVIWVRLVNQVRMYSYLLAFCRTIPNAQNRSMC